MKANPNTQAVEEMTAFHFTPGAILTRADFPADMPRDIIQPGTPADMMVAHWRQHVEFTAPVAETRDFLADYGAWDGEELADHDANVTRLIWVCMGDIVDSGEFCFSR